MHDTYVHEIILVVRYRAKVEKAHGSNASVLYVDYGNVGATSCRLFTSSFLSYYNSLHYESDVHELYC